MCPQSIADSVERRQEEAGIRDQSVKLVNPSDSSDIENKAPIGGKYFHLLSEEIIPFTKLMNSRFAA